MQVLRLRRSLSAAAFLATLAALAPAASAQLTLTWTGSTDGDWNNALNWSGGPTPGPADTAIIPSGTPNVPQAVFGDVVVGSVTVNSGATIGIQAGRKITVNQTLTCNGSVSAVATGELVVLGDLVVSSTTAAFAGLDQLELRGDGSISATTSVLLPKLAITGGVRRLASGRCAELFLDRAVGAPTTELRTLNASSFTVEGDAYLGEPVTSETTGGSTRTLTVDGTLQWDVPVYPGGSQSHVAFNLRCNGDWEGGTPTTLEAGWVELGGTGTNVIRTFSTSTSLAIFSNLRIVEGTRLLENKNVRVLGELEVRTATFDLDWPESLEVQGTLDTNWTGASLVNKDLGATVPVVLTGNGELRGGLNPLPELQIDAGLRQSFGATVEALTLVGGGAEFRQMNATTTRVLGDFEQHGGVLGFDAAGASVRVLRVDGALRQFGGSVVSTTGADRIEVYGDWNSQSGWFLEHGWVHLEASGQLTGVSPQFKRLALDAGAREIVNDVEVFGELKSNGGTTTGAGWVELTGALTPVITGTNQIARLRVVAGVIPFSTTRIGLLEVVGGSFRLLNALTVTVDGDAHFLGGQFESGTAGANLRVLDVAGDFYDSGTVAGPQQHVQTDLRVAGNWIGNGSLVLPLGWVELDGAVPTTIGGAAPTFGNLRTDNGTHTLAANVVVQQELEVQDDLLIGSFDLEVGGTLDTNWTGASLTGVGPVRLVGDGELRTNTTSIAPVRLEGGTREVFTSRVDALEITGGLWRMMNATTCTVASDAVLTAGGIQSELTGASQRGIDVGGSLTQTGTTMSSTIPSTRLWVAGDWSSESGFVLDEGWVYLDGGNASIGGPSPTFKRLRLESGVKSVDSLTTVFGELYAQNGSTTGPEYIEFTDALTPVFTGVNQIANLRVVGGTVEFITTRIGDLELTGGVLRLLNAITVTVDGDARLLGGTFESTTAGASLRVLDIAGDLTESGTIAGVQQHVQTDIRVGGDWVGDGTFVLPLGWVELDGAAPATIGGAAPTFGNLRTDNGQHTLLTDLVVEQELEVQDLLDIAAFDVEVGGTLDVNWAGADIVGVGPLRLVGDGELRTTTTSIVPVRLEGGTRLVHSSRVDALEITGGVWRMMNATTCTVAGDAVLTGGLIESDIAGASSRGIDVAGSLTQTGTALSSTVGATRLWVAGDWSSESNFVLDEGWVYLDGGDATVGGPSPTFKRLRLQSGVKSLASPVTVFGELYAQSGSTAGTEFLVLTDALTPVFTGANQIAKLRVAGGTVSFTTTRCGDLQLIGGVLTILNAITLTVDGDAEFTGGAFLSDPAGASTRTLDVAGDFTATGAVVAGEHPAQTFRVAGDWASNSTFALTQGVVELDGASPSFVRGSVPGLDPMLPTLRVKNGTRRIDGVVELVAGLVDVQSTGRLEATAGGDLRANGVPFQVNGTLAASAGGRLSLDAGSAITVNGGGRLELIGAPGDPAILGGLAGGGYACTVTGTLAARDFVVSEPGVDGLVMNGTYAAAPDDLRGGEFSSPSATPGSALLTLGHVAGKTISFVRFEDDLGVGTYNVRRTLGNDVAFQNFGGLFGGEVFEDDPGDRIDWLPPLATELVFFSATNGPEESYLAFETSFEANVDRFVLEAGPTAGGPFATVAELLPTGPGSYAFTDTGLAPDTLVFYRLLERQTDGFLRLLGEDSATPYSAALPANIRSVGPTGEFSTIQAAIDAATAPFSVIRVAPGTYSSFSVVNPTVTSLSILPEAPGVVIDASAAPVTISGVGFGKDIVLADLVINGGTSDAAVVATANFGAVIVDRCTVNGGASRPGLDAIGNFALSLQDCGFSGTPGLKVATSSAYASRGSIDTLDASGGATVRLAGVTPGATVGDGSETLTVYTGVSPQLTVPRYQSIGQPFSVDLDGEPGTFWQLAFSVTTLPLDLNDPAFWQMILLIDATAYFDLAEGTTDGAGQASTSITIPPQGGLLGIRLLMQGWTIQVVPTVAARFTGAQPVVAMP